MQNSDLINELGTNFIEYAVAVNTDRAIPNSEDGLKPVHKRILWAAYEGGYLSSKNHVKNATIVGDVIGHYHPHGDTAAYGAEVRLSQDWVMRYPLIDWHGNNGNIAGDGAAHQRYTEGRLAKIAEDGMLEGLKKKNVDFIPNFAEDREEPVSLPAIFPNLLCNPNMGIGVAMACNWAPHNLIEVSEAINQVIKGEEPTLPGPDFPTGGIVINKNDIPNIMKTGHGSVKVRGRYKVEKDNIVFYEIPYGTTIEALMTQIGELCETKDIEGISNIRDESNKKGIRIVIQCNKGENPDNIALKLFMKTDLQKSFSYNQVALVGKTPTELNLKQCIDIYIKHNINCIKKETTFDLAKAEAKLEVIEGLLIALEDIDNIIAKIKASENAAAAKETLMEDYKMTEVQAKAVLDMKLAKLAKLEKLEVEKDKACLVETIKSLKNILEHEDVQLKVLQSRLQALVKKYGDARRTELAQIEIPKEDKEIEQVVPEDCVVVMSKDGIIKRVPTKTFKPQRRNGKGNANISDAIMDIISTNTIDNLMLFTNKGKMYRMLVDNVPAGTNASKGINIKEYITMEPGERVIAMTSVSRQNDAKYVVFFTKNGLMKKTEMSEYKSLKKSTGSVAIKLKENDTIADVCFMNQEQVILITKKGMSIRFAAANVGATGRATMGVRAINLNEGDEVIGIVPIKDTEKDEIAIFTGAGFGKKVSVKDFVLQGRGGKGVIIEKVSETTGELKGAAAVTNDNLLILVGDTKTICISATEIPLSSRVALGNRMTQSGINSIVKI